jgi:hypothetical protein
MTMKTSYRITMVGAYIADGIQLAKAVFPQIDGQDIECNSSCVIVTFDTPQTPADLGPLVRVEVFDPNASRLP